MSSGSAHTTSDTVALVLFSHVISHLARQSHSKALPRRSLRKRRRRESSQRNKVDASDGLEETYRSISESRSMKTSLGKDLMLLFAKDLKQQE